ncbi:MAG: hypothetical protein FWD23_19010, partial [Oscillospiraceae bacterium]|nr:hypothetical protein [Oscillospiraceae bacterium]
AVKKYFADHKDLAEEIEGLVRTNSEKAKLEEEEDIDIDADGDELDPDDDVPLDIVVEDYED